MSGLFAIITWQAPRPSLPDAAAMAQAAGFRGSGEPAAWHGETAVLGSQSVQLTAPGSRTRQLAVDGDAGIVVAADARLDNRDDLLRTVSRYLRSQPTGGMPADSELLLACWRAWGPDCVQRLVGDFAFVIWNASTQRVFAARDPMAMRPLYYYEESGGRLVIASEIAQILAAPAVPAVLDEPAIAAHLAGIASPIERTAYRGIHQLAPGHSLSAGPTGVAVSRFWELQPSERIRYSTEREYQEHFRELFTEAVACRTRGQDRVGILLSGGVDSGSIAATAGWLGPDEDGPVHTYSWAFDELVECDERSVSRLITDHYDLPATEVAVDDAWPLASYPDHGPHRDEPFVGAFQIGIERLLAAAREEGVTMMLSGDRGDLLVGDWVLDVPGLVAARKWRLAQQELAASRLSPPEAVLRDVVRPALSGLWPPNLAPGLRHGLQRGVGRLAPAPPWLSPGAAELLRTDFDADAVPRRPMSAARRERYQLIFVPMHQRGVVWSNRTYARHGQGFADPWSDLRLTEFVLAVPQWVVQRRTSPKHLAREAMRGVMPETARRAMRKVSPFPLYERGLGDRAREAVWDLLTNSRAAAAGYVDAAELGAHYRRHLDGGMLSDHFWAALTLEWWLRLYW